ncbi:hypothetical protein SUGI_0357230 [Cryptomeria japonica]|nr:hypothetical protein SUGI_0357230 [Cryptomeria japonica]
MCIGDISTVKCSNCVVEANSSIQQRCANDICGEIWLDDCFLRYHNSNFISTVDTNGHILSNWNIINEEAFKSTTTSLLSNKGFATGSTNYSASRMLYGLVQRWRDLSMQDCRTCLDRARNNVTTCSSSKKGVQVLLGSCKLRYETYPFSESTQEPFPSPEESTPNAATPPSASTPRHQKVQS